MDNGTGVDISVHINSLNGGGGVDSDETADAQYGPAMTNSPYTTTMMQSSLSPVSGDIQPGY
jgi:hypothetical protein